MDEQTLFRVMETHMGHDVDPELLRRHIVKARMAGKHMARRRRFTFDEIQTKARVHQTRESLAKQHGCPVWVTANQELVPLKVMSIRHIKNSMKMLYCRLLTNKTYLEAIHPRDKKLLGEELIVDAMTAYETYRHDLLWMKNFYAELDRRELSHKRFDFPILYPRTWLVKGGLF